MKKVNLKSLLLLILGLYIGSELLFLALRTGNSQSLNESFQINFHANKHRILCLGESTTEGGYPVLLQERLNKSFPGKYHVYDFGKTAVSSLYFKRNIDKILNLVKPNTVISMLGINDNFMLSQAISNDLAWYQELLFFRIYLLVSDFKNNSLEQQGLRLINANKDGFFLLKILSKFGQLKLPESYLSLADYYEQEEKNYLKSLSILDLALKKFPDNLELRFNRLWSLNELPSKKKSLEEELLFFKSKKEYFDEIGQFYLNALGNKESALIYYEKSKKAGLISKRNLILYSSLTNLNDAKNLSSDTRSPSRYLETARLTPSLKENLLYIYERISLKKVKSIIMSYPLRTIEPTREAIGPGHLYLDNEAVFKKALIHNPFEKIFKDSFAGDFGHLTKKGKTILIENLMTLF